MGACVFKPPPALSPMDFPPSRSPQTKNEWGILVILSFFFFLFLVLELARQFTVEKLSVPFFLLSYAALLVIHELGHALASRIVGWRVEKISIGLGPVVKQSQISGCEIEIRLVPLSGYVLPTPRNLNFPQAKNCFIYSAGPGIELLLVLLIGLVVGFDALLTRSTDVVRIAAQSFCLAALWGALFNLIPFPQKGKDGTSWSDGLGMILCWKLPDEWYEERIEKSAQEGDPPTRAFFPKRR